MKKLLAGLLSLGLVGCASTHHEIVIDAEPKAVWDVLMGTQSYAAWNPVIIDPQGEFEVGNKVVFDFRESSGKQYEVSAKVVDVKPEQLLNQYGGFWGFLTYDHQYILQPENGSTRVIIHEDYKGVYVPFWDHSNMDASYAKLNEALKDRVQALQEQ